MNSVRHILFSSHKFLFSTISHKISVKGTHLPLIRMANEFSTESLKVEHEAKQNRFIIKLGKELAYLSYYEDPPGVFDLQHTVVPSALQGRGIGKILAKEAFDYVVKNNKKMILTCSYLVKYEKDNPKKEYKERIISS